MAGSMGLMWSTPKCCLAEALKRFRRRTSFGAVLGMVLLVPAACASDDSRPSDQAAGDAGAAAMEPANAGFVAWLAELRAEARQRGISEATLHAALDGVQPIERVIELDRKQPEGTMTFEQYLDRVVPQSRIDKARQRLVENRELLAKVEQRFGVEAEFIVALWGIESDFGERMGNFPVIDALCTLAYDGRRSAFFRAELFHALTILDEGHIDAASMEGSWAGAMGQAQFMPSSFVSYAIDFDGDGRRDIWTTREDVFASAANYLSTIGWKHGDGWGRQVRLPAGFDAAAAAAEEAPRPVSAWRAEGLRTVLGAPLPAAEDSRLATLVLPGGEGGPAYLAYDNYRVILRWNRSNYFALAVAQLAERIRDR